MRDGSIFISYRREDSAGQAGRLYDRLCEHFGKERVFIDVDTLGPGEDFVHVLDARVSSCSALVAVIGPRWLTSLDENGHRRIDAENDYVRRELAVALKNEIWIIPALVGRAQMPRPTDLPAEISALAQRNALEITDTAFQIGAAKIVEALDAIVAPSAIRSRWNWRLAVVVAVCSSVLALGVVGMTRYMDRRAATVTTPASEPPTATTRLSGSIVPVPKAGRSVKIVVDGEKGDGITNELGQFAFPVKGRDGDTVRLKIYVDGTLLYDDYAMLPGPLTISLRP